MAAGKRCDRRGKVRAGVHKIDENAAQVQAERYPDGLPPGASRVQPAGIRAEPGGEVAFAGVVGLTVRGIIGELARRDFERLQQEREQRPGGSLGQQAMAPQVEQVRDVGEVEAAVQ